MPDGDAGALLAAATHTAQVAGNTGNPERVGDTSRGAPADGTKMSHVVAASVAVVSISHNSRGAAGARPGPGSSFATRGGYVRTEGLGDLPLPQYGASNGIIPIFFGQAHSFDGDWRATRNPRCTLHPPVRSWRTDLTEVVGVRRQHHLRGRRRTEQVVAQLQPRVSSVGRRIARLEHVRTA
jgi:hypothetical protein